VHRGVFENVSSQSIGGIVRDVRWLLIPAVCLTVLMVALGYLVTEVLSSTAIGTWDAEVPRRLVEYRQQQGISESALITMLSATPTIIGLTALAAAVFRSSGTAGTCGSTRSPSSSARRCR
jgi:hypothetical protein